MNWWVERKWTEPGTGSCAAGWLGGDWQNEHATATTSVVSRRSESDQQSDCGGVPIGEGGLRIGTHAGVPARGGGSAEFPAVYEPAYRSGHDPARRCCAHLRCAAGDGKTIREAVPRAGIQRLFRAA